MALVNDAKKVINVKLACYGPAHAGKKSALEQLFRALGESATGKLKAMPVQKDRMLFFDFTPEEMAHLGEYALRFHLYTVSGDLDSPGAWKLVLKGADGVLALMDSSAGRGEENLLSLRLLDEMMAESGDIPLVFFYNKVELPGATPVEEMQRSLNAGNAPAFAGSVVKGAGIQDAFSSLFSMVATRLRRTIPALADLLETVAGDRAAAASEPVVAEEEPPCVTVEAPVEGEPVALRLGGEIRIPLAIPVTGGEKRVVLTLMLDEE